MHLAFLDAPNLPHPVLMRGWGGLRGLGMDPVIDPIAHRGWGGLWGLGQASSGPPTGTTIAASAASGAAATGSMLAQLSSLQVLGPEFAAAGPIGAAVAAAVTIGIAIAKIFSGCGQTCVAATSIANQVEPYLAQNVTNYVHTPVRYKSFQAAAVNNFDTAWNALVQACSNPALAAAGQRCISDRQRGSCKYKTSEGHGCPSGQSNCWTQDASGNCTFNPGGAAGSGNACWDWFLGYRDPIANDPCVQPDPSASDVASGSTASQVSGAGPSVTLPSSSMTPLLLIGGALVLFMFMGDKA